MFSIDLKLKNHLKEIEILTFSSDGTILASGSLDRFYFIFIFFYYYYYYFSFIRKIILWEVENGK